jgi:hypothetical protein
MPDTDTNVLKRLTDELKLQAWLAKAEWNNPSLKHEEARDAVDMLVQARDEFRVQLHLGHREANDEWKRLEERWGALKHLSTVADDLGEAFDEIVADIREGYEKFKAS